MKTFFRITGARGILIGSLLAAALLPISASVASADPGTNSSLSACDAYIIASATAQFNANPSTEVTLPKLIQEFEAGLCSGWTSHPTESVLTNTLSTSQGVVATPASYVQETEVDPIHWTT